MSVFGNLYWYAAKLEPTKRDPTGVVDGDTMHTVVDMGAYIYVHKPLRVYGVNAPEMSTADGKTAKQWAIDWFGRHCPGGVFVIHTGIDPEDKYGRLLATIYGPDGAVFNDDIVSTGHAIPYLP